MTSSLVGSEMCIRDRPTTCHLLPNAPGLNADVWMKHRENVPLILHNLASVSYTHLTLPTICSV
eukprot:4611517-Prorocentrum_lima.AAC.1